MARIEDEITSWLADALLDPNSVQAATSRALDQVDDLVGGAIVNTLNRNDHVVSRAGHELCDFLAALACAMKKFKDELDRYPDYMVKIIQRSRLHEIPAHFKHCSGFGRQGCGTSSNEATDIPAV
jgi:hypothetical protein